MRVLLEQGHRGLGLGRTQGLRGCGYEGSQKIVGVEGLRELKVPESLKVVGIESSRESNTR